MPIFWSSARSLALHMAYARAAIWRHGSKAKESISEFKCQLRGGQHFDREARGSAEQLPRRPSCEPNAFMSARPSNFVYFTWFGRAAWAHAVGSEEDTTRCLTQAPQVSACMRTHTKSPVGDGYSSRVSNLSCFRGTATPKSAKLNGDEQIVPSNWA